jgi:hypothetical protein
MKIEFDFYRDVEAHHITTYLAIPEIADDFKESGLSRQEFLEDNEHFRHWVIDDLAEGQF